MSVGSGSVDGPAGFLSGFVEHGVGGGIVGEFRFDGGAAAEAPAGSGDFGCEGFFEETFRVEFAVEGFAEFFVKAAFFGAGL